MAKAGYTDLAGHKELHAQFKDRTRQLNNLPLFGAGGDPLVVKTSDLLWDWFAKHIADVDHRYVEALKKIDIDKPSQTNAVIEKLANHEEMLMSLYYAFSEYMADKDFWLEIAAEEMSHAHQIRSWYALALENKTFTTERFKLPAIELSLQFIGSRLEEAKRKEIPPDRALGLALDIEKALLEKKFFEIFESDSVEFKHQLMAMARSIESHIEKIENESAKIKKP